MPDGSVNVLTPGDGQGDETVAERVMEDGNAQVAMTSMGNALAAASGLANQEFAASAARRTQRADQLGGDSQAMWSIAMTTPTIAAGLGYRTAIESGSGRTRAETNLPAATSAAGNGS